MQRVLVTTGHTYADIDGLACVFAYHELLLKEGRQSTALLQGVWNHSVPAKVQNWKMDYQKEYHAMEGDHFVVMDTSNITYIQESLDISKIVEIYDHHFGYEKYWQNLLGNRSHVENVGACATLIIEQWQKRLPKIRLSHHSAQLLGWALISNTLNFKSILTTKRDLDSFAYIQTYLSDNPDWIFDYFQDQDRSVDQNPRSAIHWDSKQVHTPYIERDIEIAQLEIWEGETFINKHEATFKAIANDAQGAHWLLTVVSIKDGHNYLYTTSDEVKSVLKDKIGAVFEGDRGTTKTLMLRKEILRELKA